MSHAPVAESAIYSTFGNDPDLANIIEIFVDELPERASKIEACFQREDWDGVRQVAHQLKGAAGSYGFQSITDMAARIESAIRNNESQTNIRNSLEELGNLCRRARVRPPRQAQ